MSSPNLCDAAAAQLVVVDIQERLAGVMQTADRERVIRNSRILLQAAELLQVPTIVSEQYPKGLGHTEAELTGHLTSAAVVEKSCFACSAESAFSERLAANDRKQVVLTGMESHVCVLQTAMELHQGGYRVFVVEDAACSRSVENHRNAMARLRTAGVAVSNTESVLFEWLRDAKHEHFKAISKLIK